MLSPWRLPGTPSPTDTDIEKIFSISEIYLYKRNVSFLSRRFVSNDELFDDLVSRAVQTDGNRWAVGGNAPVMALRFALEGARVLLSAKITEDMRKDLHESIEVAESSVVDKDDVHLILVLANLLLLTRQFLTSSQGGTEPHF